MLVMVRYSDDNYDIVEDYCLEYLIVTGKVAGFVRSDQWVTVGKDPVRENRASKSDQMPDLIYNGPERRKSLAKSA